MLVWLARIAGILWAVFWIWFGAASAVHDHLSWSQTLLWAARPGLGFLVLVLIAWHWSKMGGVLLVLAGFALAAWYAVNYGGKPPNEKLFVLSTFALPPVLCGLALLWQEGRHGPIWNNK